MTCKSIEMEEHPPSSGVVRFQVPMSGWRVRKIGDKLSELTVATEIDFKVELSLAKTLAPKSNNIALALRNYVLKL